MKRKIVWAGASVLLMGLSGCVIAPPRYAAPPPAVVVAPAYGYYHWAPGCYGRGCYRYYP